VFTLARNDAQLCRQTCLNDNDCKAFTFVRPNSGQGNQPLCYLLPEVSAKTTHTCCLSGTKPTFKLTKVDGIFKADILKAQLVKK
jgi:hypothetical protein